MLRVIRFALLGLLPSILVSFSPVAFAQGSTGQSSTRIIERISGLVVSTEAQHAGDSSYIITESQIQTDSGTIETVVQAGGVINGIGTREIHGPALLKTGDQVVLTVVRASPAAKTKWIHNIEKRDRPSSQFTRAVTSEGEPPIPLFWRSGCIFITYQLRGTTHIPRQEEFRLMDEVLAHWRAETQSCSYMRFERTEPEDRDADPDDKVNMVIFRESNWCRPVPGKDDKCPNEGRRGSRDCQFCGKSQQ